jgi:hypothetical protein
LISGLTRALRPRFQFLVRRVALAQTPLALWKDADPDIPILRQAKAEYARLQ